MLYEAAAEAAAAVLDGNRGAEVAAGGDVPAAVAVLVAPRAIAAVIARVEIAAVAAEVLSGVDPLCDRRELRKGRTALGSSGTDFSGTYSQSRSYFALLNLGS